MDRTRLDRAGRLSGGDPHALKWHAANLPASLAADEQLLNACLLGFDYPRAQVEALITAPPSPATEPLSIVACADYTPATLRASLSTLLDPLDLPGRYGPVRQVLIKLALPDSVPADRHVAPHPALVAALIVQLRAIWPGVAITLADASAFERDTTYLLHKSGLQTVLDAYDDVQFVDLNYADIMLKPLADGWTLQSVALPALLDEVDLFISLAKLKAHHWAGVTLTMKNLFGVLPGSVYGFPKNMLHWAGIPRVIADVTAAASPDLCLIDGVIGIEGNGPLNGEPHAAGVLLAGCDPVAVDAAGSRIMGFSPYLIPQFWYAQRHDLGSLAAHTPADAVQSHQQAFAAPPNWPWQANTAYLPPAALLAVLDEMPFIDIPEDTNR